MYIYICALIFVFASDAVSSFVATFSSFSLVEHASLHLANRFCVKMADRFDSQIIKEQTR